MLWIVAIICFALTTSFVAMHEYYSRRISLLVRSLEWAISHAKALESQLDELQELVDPPVLMTEKQRLIAEALREAWEHGHEATHRRYREDAVASLTQRLTIPDEEEAFPVATCSLNTGDESGE